MEKNMSIAKSTKQISWIDFKERRLLKDVVPLTTPLALEIEVSGFCNFRCSYCAYSEEKEGEKISIGKFYSLEAFKKLIANCENLPKKGEEKPLDTISLCGLGEPLMNKNIVEMVRLSKTVAKNVVIVTNGSLLTQELSNALVEANLDYIRISLQGLSAKEYKDISDITLDFDAFVKNIEYLYNNRKNTKVVIKILDTFIDTEEKSDKFYAIFENICDSVDVHAVVKQRANLNFDAFNIKENKSMYNKERVNVKSCTQPFFRMFIRADSTVYPCCNVHISKEEQAQLRIGDLKEESLLDLWSGNNMNAVRRYHLKNGEPKNVPWNRICTMCPFKQQLLSEKDSVDEVADALLKHYSEEQE